MQSEPARYRIGELAELSGLSVKTIRFYSDRGLVAPADRTGAGYRVYDERALAQLELVRALRELGAGLADIEKVLGRSLDLRALIAMQLEAVDAQLRILRLRRATLRAIVSGNYAEKEISTMSKLTQISDEERKRTVADFVDDVLGDLDVDPGLATRLRGALPELPDEPSPEQLDAWVELAGLVRDPDFRARIREMAQVGAADRQHGSPPRGDAMRRGAALVAARGAAAVEAGVEPGSDEARPIVAEIARAFADNDDAAADPAFRTHLAQRFDQSADPRAERYWQLLAVINGWPPAPSTTAAWSWTIDALRASA